MDSRILPRKVWQYLTKDQKAVSLDFGLSNQTDYLRVEQEEFGDFKGYNHLNPLSQADPSALDLRQPQMSHI